jgi:DNA-binding XRE family transcriptional regulator
MTGKQFAELRKMANLTQDETAKELGVKVRGISTWETSIKSLALIEARAIRALFLPLLLDGRLREICEQTFTAVPSEVTSVWLVQDRDCILMPSASRIQDFTRKERMDVPSPQCIASLYSESLTTYPLRSGEMVNLAGDSISHHKAKKYREGRSGHQFRGGICESLLHVPMFIESAGGPQPVLLLSLENKLDEQQQVIVASAGVTRLYTAEDEHLARCLAQQARDELRPVLELLDMYGG